MIEMRDEFLSEEDADLKNLSDDELDHHWTEWLIQAQISNNMDARDYSHGVFIREPSANAPVRRTQRGFGDVS